MTFRQSTMIEESPNEDEVQSLVEENKNQINQLWDCTLDLERVSALDVYTIGKPNPST